MRTCKNCGVDISHKQKNAKYCGDVCRQDAFNKRKYGKIKAKEDEITDLWRCFEERLKCIYDSSIDLDKRAIRRTKHIRLYYRIRKEIKNKKFERQSMGNRLGG